jgi:hypothetical protein
MSFGITTLNFARRFGGDNPQIQKGLAAFIRQASPVG